MTHGDMASPQRPASSADGVAPMRRLNDPDGGAFVHGVCGDNMEIYVVVEDATLVDVAYYTDGCEQSRRCGAMVADLARGRSICNSLRLSPADVLDRLDGQLVRHEHCAVLAVSALHRALADYLVRYHES